MNSQRFTNSGSIVFRLRLAFGLVFFALLFFGSFSQQRFADISERKDELSQRAVPLLVRSQDLVALLSTQSQQVTTLRDIDTRADFDEIAAINERRKAQFNDSITRYQQLSPDGGLKEAADLLFTSTEYLIGLQTERQSFARQREVHLARLREVISRMDIEIEGLRLNVLTRFQADLDQLAANPLAAGQIGALSSQLNTLVSLGLLIDQMQDLAQGADPSLGGVNADIASEEIRFVLRQALGQLNRLPASPERAALATDMGRARLEILDTTGIIQNARDYSRVQVEISQAVTNSFDLIKNIETIIAQTISTANETAQDTSDLLNASIRSLTVTNLGTIAVLFLGLVVILFLIELQLNRRMQSLSKSVRHLSVGQFDEPIDVDGSDELGAVADSLRLSQDLSRDLQRSNADLQSFAYAASHDLKTPLRAISDLAEWTLEDASDQLSQDNRQNLVLLASRSERLSNLLDGLLLYAQIDGMEDRNDVFDLAAECAGMADLLDPDGRFTVSVDPDHPPFVTSVIPLRQILTNLLSNAMKHHDAKSGLINVRATVVDKFVDIEVRDDGPGIALKYHAKIFELFQKLESADVVEGAGIGLALVQKLSQRHGGGVWLKPTRDGERGSVFNVLLSAHTPPSSNTPKEPAT